MLTLSDCMFIWFIFLLFLLIIVNYIYDAENLFEPFINIDGKKYYCSISPCKSNYYRTNYSCSTQPFYNINDTLIQKTWNMVHLDSDVIDNIFLKKALHNYAGYVCYEK